MTPIMEDREMVERKGRGRRKEDSTCVFHEDISTLAHSAVNWKVLILVVGMLTAGIGVPNLLVWNSTQDFKRDLKNELVMTNTKMAESDNVLHRRISDNAEERTRAIDMLEKTLNEIDKNFREFNWRLNSVEKKLDTHTLEVREGVVKPPAKK